MTLLYYIGIVPVDENGSKALKDKAHDIHLTIHLDQCLPIV